MKHTLIAVAILAFATPAISLADTPTPAPATSPAAATIAVVPFGEPNGDVVDAAAAEDHAVVAGLQQRNVKAVMTDAMLHLDVPKNAPAVCKRTGAQAIMVGSTRTEQNLKVTYAVFTDITHYPTHAELRLSLLDCAGHVLWRTVALGDRDYYWSNVGAAVSETATMAVDHAVSALPLPLPAAPLPLPAVAPATASAGVVVIPVSEPGSADGLLDETTTQILKRVQAVDATAVVAPAMDRFDALNAAASLCSSYHAKGIVFGSVRTEQTVRTGLKSHAEIFTSFANCAGSVEWTEHQTAENTHFGSNFRSGASAAIGSAFDAMDARLGDHLKSTLTASKPG